MQATGAIQPSAAAIRRTLLQQGQVGLLLACGLSGRTLPALGTGLFMHGAACRLREACRLWTFILMLAALYCCAGMVAGEGACMARQQLAWCCRVCRKIKVQTESSGQCLSPQEWPLIMRLMARSGRVGAGVRHQRERSQLGCHLCFAVLHRHDVRPGHATCDRCLIPDGSFTPACAQQWSTKGAQVWHCGQIRPSVCSVQSTNTCVLVAGLCWRAQGCPSLWPGLESTQQTLARPYRHAVAVTTCCSLECPALQCLQTLLMLACALDACTSSAGGVWVLSRPHERTHAGHHGHCRLPHHLRDLSPDSGAAHARACGWVRDALAVACTLGSTPAASCCGMLLLALALLPGISSPASLADAPEPSISLAVVLAASVLLSRQGRPAVAVIARQCSCGAAPRQVLRSDVRDYIQCV